ncbi:hypothetical protein CP533_2283 [Ophiocordyceps camponoti-saundersi (nom. inval.)]|nr:hypothetical protein CP533_2283 [Ophiocordyceps camponoti-saundersi (nom. inval.)]
MRVYYSLILAASVICSKAPIKGFTAREAVWKADMDPANSFVLHGTIQDAKAQLLSVNPSWVLSDTKEEAKKEDTEETTPRPAQLSGHVCNAIPTARTTAVEQAVKDLENSSRLQLAFPTNSGDDCVNVSCVNDARVWWCYSNLPAFHWPDSWRFFVQLTRELLIACSDVDHPSFISGQYSTSGGHFTVIMHGEQCESMPDRIGWRIPRMASS